MAWARISDDFLDHPKVAELTVDMEGLAALGLWASALCWVRADRRRRGIVPLGIAIRHSAGAGRKLAERLLAVRLWDELEDGSFRFHDYEDVYTPGDLSEKRAAAGRSGGKASGRTRASRAATPTRETPKQVASTETASSGSSLFDDDDPLTAGSAPSSNRTNNEANRKQLASSGEAKPREASHTRAGATTHYPEPSNEGSSPSPTAKAPTPADGLFDSPEPAPTVGDPAAEARNRAFGVARWWIGVREAANTPVIAGGKRGPLMPLRSLIEPFTGSYTDDEIKQALTELDTGFPSKTALDTRLARNRRIQQNRQPALPSGYEPRGTIARADRQVVREASEVRNARGWLDIGADLAAAGFQGGGQ